MNEEDDRVRKLLELSPEAEKRYLRMVELIQINENFDKRAMRALTDAVLAPITQKNGKNVQNRLLAEADILRAQAQAALEELSDLRTEIQQENRRGTEQ